MVTKEYFDAFEKQLTNEALQLATSMNALKGQLLSSADFEERWKDLAPLYLADAVQLVVEYPTVSVSWAAYMGMAAAQLWDTDYKAFGKAEYTQFYDDRGFDYMDEYILEHYLDISVDSPQAKQLEMVFRSCGRTVIQLIHREQIEPQSPAAYQAFVRASKVMFLLGASVRLQQLGYKYEKVAMPTDNKNIIN